MLTIITLFTGDIYFYPHFIHHTSVSVPVHRYSGNGQERIPLPAVTE
ncbi:hypothetical protein AAH106_18645 [Parabacteroides distasonis]